MKLGVARKFGPDISKYITQLHAQNIDAYEIGFAYGPRNISEQDLTIANNNNVKLSGHLPFWINLGNLDNAEKNIKYLSDGLKLAEILESMIVFHLGFYGKNDFKTVFNNILNCLNIALAMNPLKNGFLGIETTGKQKAIGTIEEIVSIINALGCPNIFPIIDWSHVFARSNGTLGNSGESVEKILHYFEDSCINKPNYFHGGSILYKDGNELKHISSRHLQPSMPIILEALYKRGYADSTIIIESPDSINDVNWLKNNFI